MRTRKLLSRAITRLQWFDKLEALGLEYEEALFVYHDRLAPLDEANRKREFRRIAKERMSAEESAGPTC